MRRFVRVLAIACTMALWLAPIPAASQGKTSVAIFFGHDIGPSAHATYGGAVAALNGDFGRDGVLLRALGVYGWYDYVAGVGAVDGTYSLFDAMVGYQILRPKLRLAGYIGIEHQNHHLSPADPTNPVSGSEAAFKVAGDLTVGHGEPVFVNIMAARSGAFDTYWARVRAGYNAGHVTLGPELTFGGNDGHDSTRVGGFVGLRLVGTPIELTLAAGRHFNKEGGTFDKDGAYGSLNVGFTF